MKRIFAIFTIVLIIATVLVPCCYAETVTEPVVDSTLAYSEKEQLVKDVIEYVINKGDEVFAEATWWKSLISWIRSNLGSIIAGAAGIMTLWGSLTVLLKTNPKLKGYISSLGKKLKEWVEAIKTNTDNIIEVLKSVKANSAELKKEAESMRLSVAALIEALEDVIKLSGADEEKKAIYIINIEKAKNLINKGNNHEK